MNEQELIRACQNRDNAAQHRLFDAYAGRLMTICRRYAASHQEAEDMLQEAFIRVFKHVGQYRGDGSFEGWLRRITVNTALQFLQKRKIEFVELDEIRFEPESQDHSAVSGLDAEDLMKLIARLPDGYRTVFNLFAIEGYSHEEISAMLHIQTASSRSQLSKARALLREKINSLQEIRVQDA